MLVQLSKLKPTIFNWADVMLSMLYHKINRTASMSSSKKSMSNTWRISLYISAGCCYLGQHLWKSDCYFWRRSSLSSRMAVCSQSSVTYSILYCSWRDKNESFNNFHWHYQCACLTSVVHHLCPVTQWANRTGSDRN